MRKIFKSRHDSGAARRCPYCPKRFPSQQYLSDHLYRRHRADYYQDVGDGAENSRAPANPKTYDSRKKLGRSASARSRSPRRAEASRDRRRTRGLRRRRRTSDAGGGEPVRASQLVYSSRRLDASLRPIPLAAPVVHDPEKEQRRARLESWYLGVHLLLIWDDQKTVSAADMEKRLTRFLKEDATRKHRITPRPTTEIFLRGVLRTLWDIDRLLKLVNPDDELTKFTRESPLVLSILRVMAYEYMWLPPSTEKSARQGVQELMEKCALSGKSDRDWITEAVLRMRQCFDKSQEDWEKNRRAREERKRAGKADGTVGGAPGISGVGVANSPPAAPPAKEGGGGKRPKANEKSPDDEEESGPSALPAASEGSPLPATTTAVPTPAASAVASEDDEDDDADEDHDEDEVACLESPRVTTSKKAAEEAHKSHS